VAASSKVKGRRVGGETVFERRVFDGGIIRPLLTRAWARAAMWFIPKNAARSEIIRVIVLVVGQVLDAFASFLQEIKEPQSCDEKDNSVP
jgi:hypothetical protein